MRYWQNVSIHQKSSKAEGDTRWCPSEDRPDGMELQGLEAGKMAFRLVVEKVGCHSTCHLQGKPFTLPNDVFDRLYGYQREGVAWMAKLLSRQHGGRIFLDYG